MLSHDELDGYACRVGMCDQANLCEMESLQAAAEGRFDEEWNDLIVDLDEYLQRDTPGYEAGQMTEYAKKIAQEALVIRGENPRAYLQP